MNKCKNNIMFNFTPPHYGYVVNGGLWGERRAKRSVIKQPCCESRKFWLKRSNVIGGAHGSCVSPIFILWTSTRTSACA